MVSTKCKYSKTQSTNQALQAQPALRRRANVETALSLPFPARHWWEAGNIIDGCEPCLQGFRSRPKWQQLGWQRLKVEIYISPSFLMHNSHGSFSWELMLMFLFLTGVKDIRFVGRSRRGVMFTFCYCHSTNQVTEQGGSATGNQSIGKTKGGFRAVLLHRLFCVVILNQPLIRTF